MRCKKVKILSGRPSAPHSDTDIEELSTNDSFSRQLDLSVSAAFNVGQYSGDGTVTYHRDSKINSYNNVISIKTFVVYRPQRHGANEFVLSAIGRTFLHLGYDVFRYNCGDRFVIGFRRGATFLATLTTANSSDQKRERITEQARVSSRSASAKNDFLNDIVSRSDKSTVSYKVVRDGTTDDLPNLRRQ